MLNIQNLTKKSIITKDKHYTYLDLIQLIESYSKLFNNKGYNKVAIYSDNSADWIAALYAGWKNNCIIVPIDYMASIDDVDHIINDCRPELIFFKQDLQNELEKVVSKLDYSPELITLGNIQRQELGTDKITWDIPADVEQTALIVYTSGTTGKPKGVMLSFKNLIANISSVSKDVTIFTSQMEVLILLPLHHILPLAGSLLAPLFVGGTVVISPSMQPSDLMETLKNNRINLIIGVPRLYEMLYKGIKTKLDSSSITRFIYKTMNILQNQFISKKIFKKVHKNFGGELKYLVSGGAALPKHIGSFFKTLGFEVLEGFGMTEASPIITFTRPGDMLIGSPGKPLPKTTVEIRDGEIVAKGDNIMKGYYNRQEETAEVLKDGWLYTGDLGHFDKNGNLLITGRKKDILVMSNGKKINPIELELKLMEQFKEIKEVGVFLHQETLYAAIYADYEYLKELNIQDVHEYFRLKLQDFNSQLTPYSRIVKFVISDSELPKTRLDKIQRYKLSELITSHNDKPQKTSFNPCSDFSVVKSFIETQVDIDVKPEHHIDFDLGMDSLSKLSLIEFINKSFGVHIDETRLVNFNSIYHLTEYIQEKKQWFKQESINWADTLREKVNINLPKSWPTHNLFTMIARLSFKTYFRLTGEGINNIPEGPCIIAPNHQSFFDGLFIASFLKRKTMKQTYFYAKKKHVNNKLLRFLAQTNNIIVVDIEKDIKESIQKMAEVLKRGKKIIIFPEGTRSETGQLGEFKKTFAILSKELQIPIVPVAINGAYNALPKGKKVPKLRSKIMVSFLKPVFPFNQTYHTLTEQVSSNINQNLF